MGEILRRQEQIMSTVRGVHASLIEELNDILQVLQANANKGVVENQLKVPKEHEYENGREEVEEPKEMIRFFGNKRVVNGGKQRK